jgi:hypothetical protein
LVVSIESVYLLIVDFVYFWKNNIELIKIKELFCDSSKQSFTTVFCFIRYYLIG